MEERARAHDSAVRRDSTRLTLSKFVCLLIQQRELEDREVSKTDYGGRRDGLL